MLLQRLGEMASTLSLRGSWIDDLIKHERERPLGCIPTSCPGDDPARRSLTDLELPSCLKLHRRSRLSCGTSTRTLYLEETQTAVNYLDIHPSCP